MASFTLPTAFYILDLDLTKVVQLNVAEEEEEQGSEKLKELEVLIQLDLNETLVFEEQKDQIKAVYYSKVYNKPHLHLASPPPDVLLIS
jgi:hypothetical protein